jgi:pimeloyl-ACP methyl ester carboxylesterase
MGQADGMIGVVLSSRAATLERPDGAIVAYDVCGQGPPVVFVHGLTSFRQSWTPVTRLLADDATCVTIDLRGHGASSRATDYAMPALASDVRAAVERVGLGDAVIVGHSMGATVAAVYAAAYRPRGVVCVDSTLRFGDFAATVQARGDALRGDCTMEAVLAIDHELGLEPYADIEALERRVRSFPRDVVLSLWETLLTTPADQLTQTAEALLARITSPLLSIHGSPPPDAYESWLNALVPQAQIEVWNGSGHMLHLVDPVRFAERIRRLVADTAGR